MDYEDLKPTERLILRELEMKNKEWLASAMSFDLDIKRSNLSQYLRRLKEYNYISTRKDKTDKRLIYIKLEKKRDSSSQKIAEYEQLLAEKAEEIYLLQEQIKLKEINFEKSLSDLKEHNQNLERENNDFIFEKRVLEQQNDKIQDDLDLCKEENLKEIQEESKETEKIIKRLEPENITEEFAPNKDYKPRFRGMETR